MLTVNEPGLYRLIFRSRKPAGRSFKELGCFMRYCTNTPCRALRDPGRRRAAWTPLGRPITGWPCSGGAPGTHGRAAAARIWSTALCLRLQLWTSRCSDVDQALASTTFENHCRINGKRHDFVRSSVLISINEKLCMRRLFLGQVIARCLSRCGVVAVMYEIGKTGLSMWPVKRSDTDIAA